MDSIAKNNPLPTFIVGGLYKNGFFYEYHHGKKIWGEKEVISNNHVFRIYTLQLKIKKIKQLFKLYHNICIW